MAPGFIEKDVIAQHAPVGFIGEDVKKRHEAIAKAHDAAVAAEEAAKEAHKAAEAIPTGFIAEDVKEDHEAEAAETKKREEMIQTAFDVVQAAAKMSRAMKKAIEELPVGFIGQDVKKEHAAKRAKTEMGFIEKDVIGLHAAAK